LAVEPVDFIDQGDDADPSGPGCRKVVLLGQQPFLGSADRSGGFEVVGVDRRFLLVSRLDDLSVVVGECGRYGEPASADDVVGRGLLLGVRPGGVCGEQCCDLGPEALIGSAGARQHLGCHAAGWADEREEKVIGSDVGVALRVCLPCGPVEDLVRRRGEADRLAYGGLPGSNPPNGFAVDVVVRDVQGGQRHHGDAFAELDNRRQEVFGVNEVAAELFGLATATTTMTW
jgi:hypothetical protein